MSITGKPQMTAIEAQENIDAMNKDTASKPRIALIKLALGPHGNLSDEARDIYREALNDTL